MLFEKNAQIIYIGQFLFMKLFIYCVPQNEQRTIPSKKDMGRVFRLKKENIYDFLANDLPPRDWMSLTLFKVIIHIYRYVCCRCTIIIYYVIKFHEKITVIMLIHRITGLFYKTSIHKIVNLLYFFHFIYTYFIFLNKYER